MIYFIIIACLLLIFLIAYFILQQPTSKKIQAKQLSKHNNPEINKSMLSCTCQEWRVERAKFKKGDPRRLCLHLCDYLANNQNKITKQLQAFTKTIVNMGRRNTGIPHKSPAFAFILGQAGYIATVEDGEYP